MIEIILGLIALPLLAGLIYLYKTLASPTNKKRGKEEFLDITRCKKCENKDYQVYFEIVNRLTQRGLSDPYHSGETQREMHYSVVCKKCNNMMYSGFDSDFIDPRASYGKKYLGSDSDLKRHLESKDHLSCRESLLVVGVMILIFFVASFLLGIIIGLIKRFS